MKGHSMPDMPGMDKGNPAPDQLNSK